MNDEVSKMLYRAIRELEFIHAAVECIPDNMISLIVSSEGTSIIRQGMKLLGVADLSADELKDAPALSADVQP